MREVVTLKEYYISIHALRVEGDVIYIFIFVFVPSISIHALRVEGDPHNMYAIACTHFISIHALRVEGDHPSAKSISKKFYFYPRPPGGGRPFQLSTGLPQKHFYPRPPGGGRRAPFFALCSICRFLSTPSGWRATKAFLIDSVEEYGISIHALRVEGDHQHSTRIRPRCNFYPRPPGGGRQQKRTKFSSVFAKKGEEFASLRRGKRKICRWRFKKDKFWVLIWCEGSRKSVCALASHCG